jgi:AraC-like DNA-binding protein
MWLQDFQNQFAAHMPEARAQEAVGPWSDRLRSVCGRFNAVPNREQELVTGCVALSNAAGMEIVQVATNVDHVRRSEQDIRLDFGEHIFLLLQLEGSCGVEQFGRQNLIEPGDCLLVDSAAPSRFFFGGHFSNHLSVHLPRQLLLAERASRIAMSRRLASEDPMSTALRALIAKMLRTDQRHASAAELRQLLLHTIRFAFTSEEAREIAAPKERACGRLEQARLLIDKHLTEEFLTAPWLAQRLSISMRTLQEDFSALGATVTSYIRNRRLLLARDRLAEVRKGLMRASIAEVAYGSGFNDISYFNRCFKKAFECSPKDIARA